MALQSIVWLMCQRVKKKNVNASNKMLSGREGGGGGAFRDMEYSI